MCRIFKLVPILLINSCYLLFHPSSAFAGEIQLYLDRKTMQEEILKHIAIGSSTDSAKSLMESNGFECTYVENFDIPPKQPESRGDALRCGKSRGNILAMDCWDIFFIHQNRKIISVNVQTEWWIIEW